MHDELILTLASLPESDLQNLTMIQKGTDPDLDYVMSQRGDHHFNAMPVLVDSQSSAYGG